MSVASQPCALYNVQHGYAEFGLTDLRTPKHVADRIRHVMDKTWCDRHELASLCSALQVTIGLRVRVERSSEHRSNTTVFLGDAREKPMLALVYEQLKRGLQRRAIG